MDPARYIPTKAMMRIETIPPAPEEPDPRAQDYWQRRSLTPGFDHRDVWRDAHRVAFTAAKLMERDVLESIRNRLAEAQAEGQTWEQFRANIEGELEALGWWKEREVQDPVSGRIARVNPPARMRLIFDTNMRVARTVGQWDRIQQTKDILPNLAYALGPSIRHRPEHVDWAGTVLPADDDWWSSHMPPNGWQCKCHVRQVGEAERMRAPAKKREAPPKQPREVLNTRTGKKESVPKGIDPGWDYNPGAEPTGGLDGR